MRLSTPQILALQFLPGVGPEGILKIVKFHDGSQNKELSPDALAACLKACWIKIKPKNSQYPRDADSAALQEAIDNAQAVLERNRRLGISASSYFDELFPETLQQTRDETGKKLAPPFVLFYKGDSQILKMPCIAMIGASKNTPIAGKAGEYLAGEFAKRGFCIVSGLARGCDTAAHVGALKAGGKTLAFLGQGLDSVYPPQNKQLADKIVSSGGLLMSEYVAGIPLSGYRLVSRDRLQAGISLATIVIQTDINGGTMHAANATLNAGKPLYVLRYRDK